ncbi:hypothetical protein BDR04DRAFT_1096464 [Suillus decipiens]|nr:hypothetical protein BDR04DRAFT_1096464 [Suillus decipiens]
MSALLKLQVFVSICDARKLSVHFSGFPDWHVSKQLEEKPTLTPTTATHDNIEQ